MEGRGSDYAGGLPLEGGVCLQGGLHPRGSTYRGRGWADTPRIRKAGGGVCLQEALHPRGVCLQRGVEQTQHPPSPPNQKSRQYVYCWNAFLLKHFWRTSVPFVRPLIPLFWTIGDVCPTFQCQVGSLACTFHLVVSFSFWLVRHGYEQLWKTI